MSIVHLLLLGFLGPRVVSATEAAPRSEAEPSAQSGTDAVGSDEAPLPAPPAAPGGRLTRGVFTGAGWLELGVILPYAPRLPGGRQLWSAGLAGALGLRPHRHFGVFTQLATWVGDVDQREGVDDEGVPVIIDAPVATTAWDLLGVRGFLPVGRRLEPSASLATSLVFERRPFSGRRMWGGLWASLGLAIWVAPTLSFRISADYRLHARLGSTRHFVGGGLAVAVHF